MTSPCGSDSPISPPDIVRLVRVFIADDEDVDDENDDSGTSGGNDGDNTKSKDSPNRILHSGDRTVGIAPVFSARSGARPFPEVQVKDPRVALGVGQRV